MTRTRWLWARLLTRADPLRFIFHPPTAPVELRRIYLYPDEGVDVGALVWQVCDE